MLLGMVFVFLFLVLMWIVIKISSSIFRSHALLEEKMQNYHDSLEKLKVDNSPFRPNPSIYLEKTYSNP